MKTNLKWKMIELRNEFLSLFLRRVEREITNAEIFEWLGWKVIIKPADDLDLAHSIGVKRPINPDRVRDGWEGAWTRIPMRDWSLLQGYNQREIFLCLMEVAQPLNEAVEPPMTVLQVDIKQVTETKYVYHYSLPKEEAHADKDSG